MGGYDDCPSENFCLTVPKSIVGEPCCVSENFRYNKSSWMRGGGYDDSLLEFFCLAVPRRSWGNTSVFPKIWGVEIIYA